jgi:hypothetical protein
MRPVKDAFAASIARAERTLRAKARGSVETPKERGHAVRKLADERARSRHDQAAEIVRQVRLLGLDAETLAKVDAAAKAHVSVTDRWVFVMLSASQNADVIRWINRNSKRPRKAVELWATMLEHLRMEDGAIMASRAELAERVGLKPRDLSSIMTELASINAVIRQKEGRQVRYFLSPWIATHLPSATLRAAARGEAGPLLRLMEGSRTEGA